MKTQRSQKSTNQSIKILNKKKKVLAIPEAYDCPQKKLEFI